MVARVPDDLSEIGPTTNEVQFGFLLAHVRSPQSFGPIPRPIDAAYVRRQHQMFTKIDIGMSPIVDECVARPEITPELAKAADRVEN